MISSSASSTKPTYLDRRELLPDVTDATLSIYASRCDPGFLTLLVMDDDLDLDLCCPEAAGTTNLYISSGFDRGAGNLILEHVAIESHACISSIIVTTPI